MKNSRVGFGLLGAGLIAPFHARALQASATTELIGVADLNAQRLAALTKEFGCASFDSLDAMLRDPRVDAVSILTPNHLHFDAVLRCARAGKHVLIEKPPAMSLAEVDRMARECRAAGVKAAVSVQCRTRRAVEAIRAAIRSGRFGRIRHADAYMKWFRSSEYYHMDAWRMSRRSGAGVTIQQAFHYIDVLQYLVGPPVRVQARMHNLAHPDVELEDTLLAFVEYRDGGLGVVEASTALWPGTDLRIEINGDDGTAIMVGERIDTWKFRAELPGDDEIRACGSAAVATGATGPADLGFRDHQRVIENLARAIQTGTEPEITIESVRPTLEWALAMYLSARRGTPVDLPLQDETEVWPEVSSAG